MMTTLPNVSLSSLTEKGTAGNYVLNLVQSAGVEELERRQALLKNETQKPKSMLRQVIEKGTQFIAPQLYTTLKLADFKPTQLFLAMILGQQRYEGMKMANGTNPSFFKALAGIFFPHAASTLRTAKLGVERLTSAPQPLDVKA